MCGVDEETGKPAGMHAEHVAAACTDFGGALGGAILVIPAAASRAAPTTADGLIGSGPFFAAQMRQHDSSAANRTIPFNRPTIAGRELLYVAQAISFENVSGDGYFTRACAELLRDRYGFADVVMVNSCTSALELAVMLTGIEPGDEVIMPSYTFVSSASAVVRHGGVPVFVDIRPDTLNIDESLIEDAITERTRAIMPVHYAGVGCEMDTINDIARRHGLRVIEDAAQAVNASYRGRPLGSLGDLGCFSFHDTKNIVCGEGGALLVNDRSLIERAEILRDKGTNRRQFWRGEVDKYTWVDVGSSYVPSELVCAFLYGQLEAIDHIQSRRSGCWYTYQERLRHLEDRGLARTPYVPDHCQANAHIFYLLLDDLSTRTRLIDFLAERGIAAVFHYVPLHSSPMGRKVGRAHGDLAVTDSVSSRLVRLPLYLDLSSDEIGVVCSAITEFFETA